MVTTLCSLSPPLRCENKKGRKQELFKILKRKRKQRIYIDDWWVQVEQRPQRKGGSLNFEVKGVTVKYVGLEMIAPPAALFHRESHWARGRFSGHVLLGCYFLSGFRCVVWCIPLLLFTSFSGFSNYTNLKFSKV